MRRIIRSIKSKLKKLEAIKSLLMKNGKINPDVINLILRSGFFDEKYYTANYYQKSVSKEDALTHYLKKGAALNYNPNRFFDTKHYLSSNSDVRSSEINPLFHYIVAGWKENRTPFPGFDSTFHVKKSVLNDQSITLFHVDYWAEKEKSALDSNLVEYNSSNIQFSIEKAFDRKYYLDNNDDIQRSGTDPFMHYMIYGWKEGRRPNSWFDPRFYLTTYPEVDKSKEEPLTHYIRIGKAEGNLPEWDSRYYFNYLNEQNNSSKQNEEYVPFKQHKSNNYDLKIIAFYLPQFHPISENDHAWGKGFTEWTNVSKALPQFEGHYQPRLPGELGFYDLRLKEVQKRQIELAKNYGIHGFCYHYYWFDGKKVMDTPLQQIINNPDLDFPFCINWANENWTKRWDGLDNEVILKQKHSAADDLAFLEGIKDILMDKRYIKVENKPLLMIYRPLLFPNSKETVKRWRDHAKKIGIGELYLVLTHAFDPLDPREYGFDAAVEFAPNSFPVKDITGNVNLYNKHYKGMVFDYPTLCNQTLKYKQPKYTKFRGVFPSWDNEARKPGKGVTFLNASPKAYKTWLESLAYYTHNLKCESDKKLIFLNAWNEWAEGAYVEPDRKYGYAYLEATHSVLEKFEHEKLALLKSTQSAKKESDIAIILHLFYVDLWDEIKADLKNFKKDGDLYINVRNDTSIADINRILKDFPKARIFAFENRGRDILPLVKMLKILEPLKYKYICKIHSKKSLHREDGKEWRANLIKGLISSEEKIAKSIALLENNGGIVVAKGNLYSYKEWIGSNAELVEDFAKKAKITIPDDFMFPAGSMFWIKTSILKKIIDHLDESEFLLEDGQLDGTIAHACERIVGLLCVEHELKIYEN